VKRRVYLIAGRAVTPLSLLGLKIYTKLTDRPRVRILVTNEQNEILLLREVISHRHWSLPGGGMNRNETAVAAARRELNEETGILAPESAFKYIRTLAKPEVSIPFRAPLFHIKVKRDQLPVRMVNPREIAAIGWFDPAHLPTPHSEIVVVAFAELGN
jgi:8-oxo-dGTP pyrophosphatase MutT (NUDIX family)